MSREEELHRLVDLYARRIPPTSGVVSRSRLRSWVEAQTTLDGLWEPFVEQLVARGLWAPWEGSDLRGTREQNLATYRDAGVDARVFSSPRSPPVGYIVAVLGGLGFVYFMITNPPGYGSPAFGAFFCITMAVLGLLHQLKDGRPELSVRIEGRLLHVKSEKQTRTLPLQDIEWVDVEWHGLPYVRPGKAHYDQNRFGVVASLRTGERVVLLDRVVREVALKVCRAIETAVEAPQPRIRIEATVIEELDTVDTEPSVIVDETLYDVAE